MTRGLGIVILLLALSACSGSSDDNEAPAAEASSTPTTAETTAPATPKVSDQTTCDLLFDSGTNPMLTLLEAAEEPPGGLRKAKVLGAVQDVRDVAESAGSNLAAQLVVFSDEAEAYAGGGGDVARLRAAGLEITNVCLPYYE
jgi:hypothetical protein